MTSKILLDAVSDSDFNFLCFGYEVWTPLFPNCYVDITDSVKVKTDALMQYKSQLSEKNYLHTQLGLNAYRASALLNESNGFVEAFYAVPLNVYRKLFEAYSNFKLDGNK